MKRKSLTTKQFTNIVANLDGKFNGLSQTQAATIFKVARKLDAVARALGYKSPLEHEKKKSIKEAKVLMAKMKKVKGKK